MHFCHTYVRRVRCTYTRTRIIFSLSLAFALARGRDPGRTQLFSAAERKVYKKPETFGSLSLFLYLCARACSRDAPFPFLLPVYMRLPSIYSDRMRELQEKSRIFLSAVGTADCHLTLQYYNAAVARDVFILYSRDCFLFLRFSEGYFYAERNQY